MPDGMSSVLALRELRDIDDVQNRVTQEAMTTATAADAPQLV
jgi:hypothetical protein